MVIVLRIIMLLLPLVALLMWLRWRAKRGLEPEDLVLEQRKLRNGLLAVVLSFLAAGLLLRVFDPDVGDTDSVYIPAHEVDGKLVPGRFVPKDQVDEDGKPKSDLPSKSEN